VQDNQVILPMAALLERILVPHTLAEVVVVLIDSAAVRVQMVVELVQVEMVEQELQDLLLALVLAVAEKLKFATCVLQSVANARGNN
jgi:ABC-type amino acid transport system permease subunit